MIWFITVYALTSCFQLWAVSVTLWWELALACASERDGPVCFSPCSRFSIGTCQPGREGGILVSWFSLSLRQHLCPWILGLEHTQWASPPPHGRLTASCLGGSVPKRASCPSPARGGFLCSLSPAVMGLHLNPAGFAALHLSPWPVAFVPPSQTCTTRGGFLCSPTLTLTFVWAFCAVCGEKPGRGCL